MPHRGKILSPWCRCIFNIHKNWNDKVVGAQLLHIMQDIKRNRQRESIKNEPDAQWNIQNIHIVDVGYVSICLRKHAYQKPLFSHSKDVCGQPLDPFVKSQCFRAFSDQNTVE